MTKEDLSARFTNVLNTLPGAIPFYVEQCVLVAEESLQYRTKLSETEFKEKVAQILRDHITFAPQTDNYIIHGALEAIWTLYEGGTNH